MVQLGDVAAPTGTEVVPVGDHLVVLHGPSRRTAVLNASAAAVYLSLDGRRRVRDLADELAAETGQTRGVIEAQVRAAVDELCRVGVARIVGPGHDADRPAETARRGPSRSPGRWQPHIERLMADRRWRLQCARVPLVDTTCEIRVDDASVARLVDQVLPEPVRRRSPDGADGPDPIDAHAIVVVTDWWRGRPRYRIVVDGRVASRVARPELAAEDVLHHLDALAISATPGRLLWHAGAVERGGRVAAVLGPSGRGKSTLVTSLVRRGARYLTDEVVAVAPGSMAVAPYAKTLDLDADAQRRLGFTVGGVVLAGPKHRFPVARLGQASAGGTLALLVVLDGDGVGTSTRVGAEARPVERLAPADALVALLGATFGATFATPGHLQASARACQQVPAVRLARIPLSGAAALVERLLAEPGAPPSLSR